MKFPTILSLILSVMIIPNIWAQKALDVNEVKTWLKPTNNFFWDLVQYSNYEVPKGSGKHSLFASSLWFMGLKSGTTDIHGFGDNYQTTESQPGPLKLDGTAGNMQTLLEFGRVWKLDRIDIDALILAQANGSFAAGTFTPAVDITTWPGNGPQGFAQNLAPYFDANGDNVYNIYDGDYPIIKGEQMLYWILNDNSSTHTESGTIPMGVEIHVSFYACRNDDAQSPINYTTFLEYEIINRSTNTYEDVYGGFNSHGSLGYSQDDNIGCHIDADAFYFYNKDSIDGEVNTPAVYDYGANWPVQSFQFLEGKTTNDRTMSSFMFYDLSNDYTGIPAHGSAAGIYNVIKGKFRNGSDIYYGGNGTYNAGNNNIIPTTYMFPGISDPEFYGTGGADPGFPWTMKSPCPNCPPIINSSSRGIGATGPFTLAPGQGVKIVLGILSTFDSTSTIAERVQKNRNQNKLLKQWYQNGELPCMYPSLSIEENIMPEFRVFPNPANEFITVKDEQIEPGTTYCVLDINGRQVMSGTSFQKGQITLDIKELSTGFYFVRLKKGQEKPTTIKIIKQ